MRSFHLVAEVSVELLGVVALGEESLFLVLFVVILFEVLLLVLQCGLVSLWMSSDHFGKL